MESISRFIPLDYEKWERREIFEGYKDVSFCVTLDVDITHYIERYKGHIKFYPFMNYIAAEVVNSDEIFRMAMHDGVIGHYDVMHPLYTLLRPSKLFTHKYTRYSEDFSVFYHDFLRDKEMGEHCDSLYADGGRPQGVFSTSTMPHTRFNAVSMAYDLTDLEEFSPFTAFGKYYEKDGRWYCPVATQFFHGVNDGYHAEQFYILMQKYIDEFDVDVTAL